MRRRPRRRTPRPPPAALDLAAELPAVAPWADALEQTLLDAVEEAVRGPTREGLVACWLVTRLVADAAVGFATDAKRWPARCEAVRQRLATAALPAPVRRAATAALDGLATPTPQAAALVLGQLVAPMRDLAGRPVADAVARAAAAARPPESPPIRARRSAAGAPA